MKAKYIIIVMLIVQISGSFLCVFLVFFFLIVIFKYQQSFWTSLSLHSVLNKYHDLPILLASLEIIFLSW